jgi:hypothetical protein
MLNSATAIGPMIGFTETADANITDAMRNDNRHGVYFATSPQSNACVFHCR